jgi:CMD domain protein
MSTDIIDQLAGLTPGSGAEVLRHQREQARVQSQASYDALFTAPDQTGVSPTERLAVATFVAALHGSSAALAHYSSRLAATSSVEIADQVTLLATAAAVAGPYGRFPAGTGLHDEDAPGPALHLDPAAVATLGRRLSAAFEHAHLLVFRPRESSPEALAALLDAGWSTAEIVTLSQLVAYLAFQLRVIHGLSVLDGELA